jgi:hypothetical protein
MAMRDVIKKAIEEGGATKESLLELTGTTEKGLASQFTYLRMMGTCPMKQEDGTWKIVTTEEWEAHRGAGGGVSGKILTPEERVDKAEKRSKRAASAFDNAKLRTEAKPKDRLAALKFIKAEAELEISEIELGKAEEAFMTQPEASEASSEEAIDENDENGDTEDGDTEDGSFAEEQEELQ